MPLISGCTFIGNLSVGISSFNSANPTIVNCLFYGNLNGGINLQGTDATISNCTLIGNTAYVGGGIHCGAGNSPSITNCIVRGNQPHDISGGTPIVTYCNVQDGYAGEGNIDADPVFVDLENHDYRIDAGSPCIDAGDNNGLPAGIDTDIDGNPRFVDDPFTDDTGIGDPPIVDMGAFEYQPDNTCPADVNGDEVVDINDLFDILAHWGEGSGRYDVNDDGIVDIDDLFEVLGAWGPCP